jgi:hypothetical protein
LESDENVQDMPVVGNGSLAAWFGPFAAGSGSRDRFDGSLGVSGDLCKLVFTKNGNTVEFAELSDLYGSGFLIEGNRIRGKAARCTITSRKQNGDNLELNASCASSIMTQKASFLLKVYDENNIARVIPDIENMEIKYTRCSL